MNLPHLGISAWSLCNALGRSTDEVFSALDGAQSGLAPPPLALPFRTVTGHVPGELPALVSEHAAYNTRLARLGLLALEPMRGAIHRACERWSCERVAVLIGTSVGGLDATELAYRAYFDTRHTPDDYDLERQHDFAAFGELVGRVYGIRGPNYVVSTACSSSGKIFASAQRLVAAGFVDAVLVGGIDSLCRMTLYGFHSLGILSERACKPFSAERNGINIGEGAAFVLLERDTRSEVALMGVGESSDAHRMSSPHPEGRGAMEAMQRALQQACLAPQDINLVNAHGTATLANDRAEAAAIRAVFDAYHVPVVSTKGYTGHLLGGAGATEAIFCIHALRTGRVPPTLGCAPVDDELALDVVSETKQMSLRYALSNSLAFGGSNASVLLGRTTDAAS